ncbi:hypothetical protein [Ideonella sp. A 288]|uniref:hypothetical protein n=1 Tax=Ideonella sp. A 288 TaxID=1962181 RepID=UPI001F2741C9|nr:hypothetical protein [Ideonella sp. A 288]
MAAARPPRAGKPPPPRPGTAATPTPATGRRPVLLVLAGVNGAGKSSVGGGVMLRRAGLTWFNPDTYTRLLVDCGLPLADANAQAWQHGVDLIDQAQAAGHSHAFETTLGGSTMAQKIAEASRTHDVLMWFCGLSSPEHHMARVAARVAAGGHDIPEARIRERWVNAPLNLIDLMPRLHELRVFDNSADAAPGTAVPDPVRVLHARQGAVEFPLALADLERTPNWAKPIVEAARALQRR